MSIPELYKIYLQHPQVCTDTRKLKSDCLFFALRGDNFNGNAYAAEALAKGAAYAVIDDPDYVQGDRTILVDDTLKTLQALATHHRRQFIIPVLGITGSNGKTTTKELIYAVMSQRYPTHATAGNFNNHIGVPLTLLSITQKTEFVIIEMGANHQGEIDFLCRIAEPSHGVITNIGRAHLEGFGGIEGVKKGKSELYRYLHEKRGTVFVNLDEPHLRELSAANKYFIEYKKSDNPDPKVDPLETKLISSDPFVRVAYLNKQKELVEIQSNLIGEYNFANIATAIAIGRYFKVPAAQVKAAIEGYYPENNRSEVKRIGSNQFTLDAYNANPTSMSNAVKTFGQLSAKNKVAILGDMLELGAYAKAAHQEIVDLALTQNFDQLVLVGAHFAESNAPDEVLKFVDNKALQNWYRRQQFTDTHFLLKGSRGIALERMLD